MPTGAKIAVWEELSQSLRRRYTQHFQEAGAHDRKVDSEITRDGILKMSGHQFRGPVAHSSGTSFEAQCQCVVLETKTAAPQIKTVAALVNKAEEDSNGDHFLTMRMLGNKV